MAISLISEQCTTPDHIKEKTIRIQLLSSDPKLAIADADHSKLTVCTPSIRSEQNS
jgi:hypothetical protein